MGMGDVGDCLPGWDVRRESKGEESEERGKEEHDCDTCALGEQSEFFDWDL